MGNIFVPVVQNWRKLINVDFWIQSNEEIKRMERKKTNEKTRKAKKKKRKRGENEEENQNEAEKNNERKKRSFCCFSSF